MKKKKRHNPYKIEQAMCKKIIDSLFSVMTPNKTCPELYLSNGNKYLGRLDRGMFSVKQLWGVSLIALLRDQKGKEYIQSEFVTVSSHILFNEIGETLKDIHNELLLKVNSQHYVSHAWIASHVQKEVPMETAFIILKKEDAFNNKAQWELDNEYKEKEELNSS